MKLTDTFSEIRSLVEIACGCTIPASSGEFESVRNEDMHLDELQICRKFDTENAKF